MSATCTILYELVELDESPKIHLPKAPRKAKPSPQLQQGWQVPPTPPVDPSETAGEGLALETSAEEGGISVKEAASLIDMDGGHQSREESIIYGLVSELLLLVCGDDPHNGDVLGSSDGVLVSRGGLQVQGPQSEVGREGHVEESAGFVDAPGQNRRAASIASSRSSDDFGKESGGSGSDEEDNQEEEDQVEQEEDASAGEEGAAGAEARGRGTADVDARPDEEKEVLEMTVGEHSTHVAGEGDLAEGVELERAGSGERDSIQQVDNKGSGEESDKEASKGLVGRAAEEQGSDYGMGEADEGQVIGGQEGWIRPPTRGDKEKPAGDNVYY